MSAAAHDLIVVGGGPAGATLATLVARAGHRVLLLESAPFPRYQIGESLLPATFNGIFALLGIDLNTANLGEPVLKRGATFHWGRDRALWTMNFGGAPEACEPGPEWPTAFNVRRDVFDRVLLDAARAAGVEIREGARALDFEVDEERVRGVEIQEGARRYAAHATWIAGADGQAARLAPHIGTRQASAFFRNAAVFGYFEQGGRLPPPLEGNVLLESFGDGWAWYIPLTPDLTSVGVVLHHPATQRLQGDREALYAECLTRCHYIHQLVQSARRADTAPYAGLRVRSEFSYGHSRFWRPGALLVGDAACFVDVILSSGVHLATFGALHAARALNSVLRGDLPERLALNEFELRYRLEFTKFYQGLLGLHDMRHDGPTYVRWLRAMLRQTQGVFLDDTPASGERRRTWEALAYLRKHNATMLARAAPPSMNETLAPLDLQGELDVSADGLRYQRAQTALASISAPTQEEARGPRVDAPLYDYGKVHASVAPYFQAYPRNVDQALALVRAARERSRALRVRGSGHTFSGASLPRQDEILLRTHGLDHYHFHAPGRMQAGAGALMWDLRDLAREHGFDLPVFNGGWAGPTLGGYLCAGGFGKSGLSEESGGLWENIYAVRLIDGLGELRTITRDDPRFRWLFGCYGQLGLIVDAELRLIPYAEVPPAEYPLDASGQVPRRQSDDPGLNDLAPVLAGTRRLFWFTLLAAPHEEASAWQGLEQLVHRYRGELVPDGGWAGPALDGQPIGYRYVIRFGDFNPPLVYPRPETFLVLGVMSVLASGDAASNARLREIERNFIELAKSRRLRLYLQAENITESVDLAAYYGSATWATFRALKQELDPHNMFNPGVVFGA